MNYRAWVVLALHIFIITGTSNASADWQKHELGIGSPSSGYTLDKNGDLAALQTTSRGTQDIGGNESARRSGKARSGMSFGFGLGAQIPVDNDTYGDLGADLYPELQIVWDHSAIQMALTVGYVYREFEQLYSYSYGYYDYFGYDYEHVEYHFLPIFFTIGVMPLRFANPNMVFQFYVGGGPGVYLSVGDGDSHFALSPKLGLEFYFGEFFVMDIEGRYVWVSGDEKQIDEGYSSYFEYGLGGGSLSYYNVMMAFRFRIPFVRRSFK